MKLVKPVDNADLGKQLFLPNFKGITPLKDLLPEDMNFDEFIADLIVQEGNSFPRFLQVVSENVSTDKFQINLKIQLLYNLEGEWHILTPTPAIEFIQVGRDVRRLTAGPPTMVPHLCKEMYQVAIREKCPIHNAEPIYTVDFIHHKM